MALKLVFRLMISKYIKIFGFKTRFAFEKKLIIDNKTINMAKKCVRVIVSAWLLMTLMSDLLCDKINSFQGVINMIE